jgi:hemoglobin/transferrin/lactoferrin receptor protein
VGQDSPDTSPRPAILFEAPKDKLTVDAGLRLFDRRLVLGARGTYVSDTLPKFGQLLQTVDSYKVYDLYGSFEFTKQAKLRVGVSNVADEAYVPSLGSASYPAPGRTYTAAMKLKF